MNQNSADAGSRYAPQSIRRNLMRIVLAALLPMGLFAGLLFFFLWENQQSQRNQEQVGRVRAMAAVVESELDNTVGRLRVIGTNPLLDPSTMRAFDARSRKVLAENDDWENLLLLSRQKQLMNLAVPFGTPLPERRLVGYQEKAFATMRPTVSDLFTARIRGGEAVSVAVPVIRNGKAEYLLLAGIKREPMAVEMRKMIPIGGIATIYDRNLRVVARTQDMEASAGALPGEPLLSAMRASREGVIRGTTREGARMFVTWTTLDNGWSIATGSPSAAADRSFIQYMALLGLAWLVMVLAGLVMARLFWRRIDRDIAATIDVATQLAAGKAAEFPPATVRELASISGAITTLFARERKARAESDAANSAKDEFLAMLGHELRNPIGAIANAVHIMDDEKRTQSGDLLARRVIVRQTDVLRRLIDDLLDIGRVLTGKIALELGPLELSGCVGRAIESLGASGKTARHHLDVHIAPVWIEGDATRVEQVLTNLVVNAVNHTPADGRIRIELAQEGSEAVLKVSDTGVGIAAGSLPKVFDLFYQEVRHGDRPQGGLGIGLTLVQRLVQLHGGTIVAASDGTGKGAAFTVRIPASAKRLPDPVERRHAPRHEGRKVLIIEDNMDARETLRAALELDGHEVQTAPHGPGGLELLKSYVPDAAIIDIGLPGMDGYAVARAIRGLAGKQPLLIALTGYGLPEDERKAAEAGFDAHVVKPADLARLAALLSQARKTGGFTAPPA